MGFDVDRARRDTPACTGVLHLNNAGASLMPQPVLDATIVHLRLEAAIGGYEAAAAAEEAVDGVYDAAGSLFNASREEIAVVESATRAWDMAFYSIPFQPGDRVLTASNEYASNFIAFLQMARRRKIVIDVIPSDADGQISLDALSDSIDDRVRLIALTHVPTNGGLVQPAEAVGRIAREAGVLYLLDACQSAGQMPIDVRKIGCDFLSATGRKYLRGPRGTGLLYVRKDRIEGLDPPFLDLHAATWVAVDRYEVRSDARRFENWEASYAGKIGLATAIRYALGWGLDAIRERVYALAAYLRTSLREIDGICVHDLGREQCGIVTFTAAGCIPEDIKQSVHSHSINVACTYPRHTRLDMDERGLDGLVRASVHYYNTEKEIDRFSSILEEIVRE